MPKPDALPTQVEQDLRELLAIQAAQTFLIDSLARIVLLNFPADIRAGFIEALKGVNIQDVPTSEDGKRIAQMTRDFLESFGDRLHAAFKPTGQQPN
ncbi:MAG: hypothetical protein AB7O50_15010 [Pseudolabrys sp.]